MSQTPKTPCKTMQYHDNQPLYYLCVELAMRLSSSLSGGACYPFTSFIKLTMVKEA